MITRRGFIGSTLGVIAGGAAYAKTDGGLLVHEPEIIQETAQPLIMFEAIPRHFELNSNSDTVPYHAIGKMNPYASVITDVQTEFNFSMDVVGELEWNEAQMLANDFAMNPAVYKIMITRQR